jgi:hypothetical protein
LTRAQSGEATRPRLTALCLSGFRGEYLRLHREFLQWLRPFVVTARMAEIAREEEIMLWAFTFTASRDLWHNLGHVEEWLTPGRQT